MFFHVSSRCIFSSGKKHFRTCDKTSLVFISALAWSVPGCVGATSDNPPLYTSCWRWTWSLFSPAATPSDDWRGRISWKTANARCSSLHTKHAVDNDQRSWCWGRIRLIIFYICFLYCQNNFTRTPTMNWSRQWDVCYSPVPYISIVVILSVKHTVSLFTMNTADTIHTTSRQMRIDPQLETVPNRFLGKSQSAEEDRVKSWKLQGKKLLSRPCVNNIDNGTRSLHEGIHSVALVCAHE